MRTTFLVSAAALCVAAATAVALGVLGLFERLEEALTGAHN